MSGTPFTVFDSNDVSEQGGAPEITGFSANRPNLVPGQNPNAGPHTTGAWLNANAFQRLIPNPSSPVQQFGTAGRNIAQGPGYGDWDFSAFKNIRVAEGKEFQFRAEFFNIFNHPNFANPYGGQNGFGLNDPSVQPFGCGCATPDIAAANPAIGSGGPRSIQLGAKFVF